MKKWSTEEIEILISLYPITDNIEIVKLLPERTIESIKVKAKRLKIYRNNEIKKKNRSHALTGENNGMYKKTSLKKNKKYHEIYGNEKSLMIRNKISKKHKGKFGLCGDKNGMYGKTPINKGKTPSDSIRNKIKEGVINYWNNLNDYELKLRKDKLRKEWIIKRDKYCEIDTIPEKIVENILLELNISFMKKITIGYYNCDFVIDELIIEVQGDYWHANPKIYENYDRIQDKNVKRDKRKYKYLTSNGYNIIYLWEYDLKNNLDYCKNIIINSI